MRALSVLLAVIATGAGASACDAPPGAGGTSSSVGPTSLAPPAADAPVADFASLAQEPNIPSEVRERVRAFPVAFGHVSGHSALEQGLAELAARDPQMHKYQITSSPGRGFFRDHGGMASYSVGQVTHPDQEIDTFYAKDLNRDGFGDAKAMFMAFEPENIPSGTRTEMAYKQYTTTMDVNASRVELKGVFTETLFAPRIITTGNATFYAGEVPYPIELPNVSVDNYHGTAQVPSGAVADDDEGGNLLSVRDPRMVYSKYQEALASVEHDHPAVAMIYSTVPLETSGNYQRNYFNHAIRIWCASHHQPLFDAASILAHDAVGAPTLDRQGETMAADMAEGKDAINAAGRARLAAGWWVLMAKMQGWKPS